MLNMGYYKRGQTVSEMALFGSLILLVFGTLVSYIQRFNDQQYVQMEAFRRALERGCTYQANDTEGAGASVQYTLIQHRRQADLSGAFRKGSAQSYSASANVFWAVPKAGVEPDNLIVLRVNEDERQINSTEYKNYLKGAMEQWNANTSHSPVKEEDLSFESEAPNFAFETNFAETNSKKETHQGITNTRSSTLYEKVNVSVDYTIRKKTNSSAPDDDNQTIVERGNFWAPQQWLYLDNQQQYKYSSRISDPQNYTGVSWEREWQSDF